MLKALKKTKSGKLAGFDGSLVVFLKMRNIEKNIGNVEKEKAPEGFTALCLVSVYKKRFGCQASKENGPGQE